MSSSSSALQLSTDFSLNLSLPQTPRECLDVQAGSRIGAWGKRPEWPSLLLEIRQGLSDVMGRAPRSPQLGQLQCLKRPRRTPAFRFNAAPPAHPPREPQSAEGREVLRPSPSSTAGKGKEGRRKPTSPASQSSCQLHGPAAPAIPTQSRPFSTPGGDPGLSFPPSSFLPRAQFLPGQETGASAGNRELDTGPGAWQRPLVP